MESDMKPQSGIRACFTLLELLVVITIIVILISMLLPAISKAKGVGYSVKCKGNLKQIGVAYQCYLNDFNLYVPPCYNASWGGVRWYGLIDEYLGLERTNSTKGYPQNSVFVCPANSLKWAGCKSYTYGNYAANHVNRDNTHRHYGITRIKVPSMAVAVMDGAEVNGTGVAQQETGWPAVEEESPPEFAMWHASRANALLFDMHVDNYGLYDVMGTNMLRWATWDK